LVVMVRCRPRRDELQRVKFAQPRVYVCVGRIERGSERAERGHRIVPFLLLNNAREEGRGGRGEGERGGRGEGGGGGSARARFCSDN
jgi:hypothetical protein